MSPTTDIYNVCDKQILYDKINLSTGLKCCHKLVTLKQDYDNCTKDKMAPRERAHHQDTSLNLTLAGSHIGQVQMYALKDKKRDKCTTSGIKKTNKL